MVGRVPSGLAHVRAALRDRVAASEDEVEEELQHLLRTLAARRGPPG